MVKQLSALLYTGWLGKRVEDGCILLFLHLGSFGTFAIQHGARQLEVGDRWGLVNLFDDHTAAKLGGGYCDIC